MHHSARLGHEREPIQSEGGYHIPCVEVEILSRPG